MKLGVISDSHDNLDNVRRAAEIFNEEGVDLIVHLGDIVSPFTLAELAGRAKARVEAVYGNNCGEKLGLKRIADLYGAGIRDPPYTIELEGAKILLLHGYGSPEETRNIVYSLADSGRWNAILYGHTHRAEIAYRRGVLVLNPGEAGGWLSKPSVAILEVPAMRARLVWLE